MVIVTFPDKAIEKQAIGFLMGRFSARLQKSGQHILPEAALEALAYQNFTFTVLGKANYEDQVAAVRGNGTRSPKRRSARSR